MILKMSFIKDSRDPLQFPFPFIPSKWLYYEKNKKKQKKLRLTKSCNGLGSFSANTGVKKRHHTSKTIFTYTWLSLLRKAAFSMIFKHFKSSTRLCRFASSFASLIEGEPCFSHPCKQLYVFREECIHLTITKLSEHKVREND